MQKIPTVFERDWDGDRSRVTPQVHLGCEWVNLGEGVATRKYDGTCVMFDGERWWARREVREDKDPPEGFVLAAPPDENTGKAVGWEPIEQSPFAKFHAEALTIMDDALGEISAVAAEAPWPVGTYELIGPKIQKNPEGEEHHTLVLHASAERLDVPDRSYVGIGDALAKHDVEGFVFHHPDGRMAKIKKRDYGIGRGS